MKNKQPVAAPGVDSVSRSLSHSSLLIRNSIIVTVRLAWLLFVPRQNVEQTIQSHIRPVVTNS